MCRYPCNYIYRLITSDISFFTLQHVLKGLYSKDEVMSAGFFLITYIYYTTSLSVVCIDKLKVDKAFSASRCKMCSN